MPGNWQSFLRESALQIPPNSNEIELSVFGRGYGECLLISCGFQEFIVIDSFINKGTGNPIALDYMDAIGLSSASIKQIVLTHWHQDHITGITKILQATPPETKLVISPIIRKEKLLEYISIGVKENIESTAEIGKVVDFMQNNKDRVIIPTPNKVVFPYKQNGVEVYTLSPNDIDLLDYINNIIMPDEYRKTSYSFPKTNSLSIVMLIKFGEDGVLLGSDLENTKNTNSGWKGLVESYYHVNTKPSLIKIPHHGSFGAHNHKLWKYILSDKPLSVLTVFNKSKLPRKRDVERIRNLSQSLFVVGKHPIRHRALEKEARDRLTHVRLESVPSNIGLARFRRVIEKREWGTEKFGETIEFDGIS